MEKCEAKGIETNQSIKEILKEVILVNPGEKEYDTKIKQLSEKLKCYYETKGRHQYSEVSAFIFESLKEEDLDYLYDNINKIHEKLMKYDEENGSKYSKKTLKLEDHIRLELLRFEQLKDVQNGNAGQLMETIHQETEKYEKKFLDLNKGYEKQKENIDGLNNQIISIIGIFSAIVITFFGGINFINGILNSISNISKYRLVFSTLLVGFVMFNTIFMLLNFISKLTGKNIRSCEYSENYNCKEKCENNKTLKCIRSKHPTVYIVNTTFILCIIIICALYYFDYFNIFTKLINKINNIRLENQQLISILFR